jgi:hypothetical protein
VLAEDRIGESRGEPIAVRLERLQSAPQTSEVVSRVLKVITGAVGQLGSLGEKDLQAVGPAAVRLLADSQRLDEQLASVLGELLAPTAAERLRESAEVLEGRALSR